MGGERFPIDTTLTLGLHGDVKPLSPIPGRVAHCSQLPEGTWVIGAEVVTRMSPAQMEGLLSEVPVG